MTLAGSRSSEAAAGLRVFLVGDIFSRSVDSTDTNDAFKITGHGGTAGVEYGFANGVVGLAANVSRPKAEFGNDAAHSKDRSIQVGGYAGVDLGGAFAEGYAGYGKDDYDVTRQGVVDGLSASPNGNHWIAGARGGYLMPFGGLAIGPVVALDYAKAKVDGYTEDGDAALALDVRSISAKTLRGSIGAELRGNLTGGGLRVSPYGALVAEKELSGGGRSVEFAQTSAPGIVNHFAFEDISKKAYARFTGGLSAEILSNVSLDGAASLTFGRDQGDETSGHVGLKLRF
ncbi:MAG: autotransporter outer membrane beta-barrel domain-containing protein [Sphingomicrobium sp.]